METDNRLIAVVKLMRPSHYIKNIFVFLPLFFSAQLIHAALLLDAVQAFISFSIIASSIYIFNDIRDADDDRKHPENKFRPIAAGVISVRVAVLFDLLLTTIGFILAYNVNFNLLVILISYKILNILYTLILKRIAILDVLILSLGFILRLYAGSVATGIVLTNWIIIMTFLLSMLIVFGKRRNDLLFSEQEGTVLRHSIKGYNIAFLNYTMVLLSSIIVVAYIMYTVSPEVVARLKTNHLFVTVIWVIAGILRYLQLLFVYNVRRNPISIFYNDHPLKLILIGWIATFLFFIYT